jgi:Flp pilus assembly protein TadG
MLADWGSLESQVPIRAAAGRRSRRRQGAATVELAIAAPVVLFITLSIIDVGRCMMVIHLLNNAAQLGCRAGIVEGRTTDNIKSLVVDALTSTGVSGETATIQINDGSADASTAVAGDEITVRINVPVRSISWTPITRLPGVSLQGQYTMRRE